MLPLNLLQHGIINTRTPRCGYLLSFIAISKHILLLATEYCWFLSCLRLSLPLAQFLPQTPSAIFCSLSSHYAVHISRLQNICMLLTVGEARLIGFFADSCSTFQHRPTHATRLCNCNSAENSLCKIDIPSVEMTIIFATQLYTNSQVLSDMYPLWTLRTANKVNSFVLFRLKNVLWNAHRDWKETEVHYG